jgi:hypothetical protein
MHPYVPGYHPERQLETWEELGELLRALPVAQIHAPCTHDRSYAFALADALAAYERVIICEQDIVPTRAAIASLLGCPEPWCATDYRLAGKGLWSTWADHGQLGLAKVTRAAMAQVAARPAVPHVPWTDLAYELGQRLGPAHLHREPVAHNHPY